MNDNIPANMQLDTKQNGTVTFAPDVLATIAGLAATEVEGVVSMVGPTGLADILSRKGQSRNLTRGIKIEIDNDAVNIDVSIIVDFGAPVPEVAYNIQENVKKAIETMSGRMVSNVDVHIQGLSFEKENRTAAELEVNHRKLLHKQNDQNKLEESKFAQDKNVAGDEIKAPVGENANSALEDESDPAVAEEALDDAEYELDLEDVEEELEEAASLDGEAGVEDSDCESDA